MAETKGKKKAWPKVATIRKNDNGSYIKLESNVDIYVDGQKLELSDNRVLRLEDPRVKVKEMHEKGYITEQKRDERLEKLSEMAWLRFDVIAPPRRD